jgi:hypothetical protein
MVGDSSLWPTGLFNGWCSCCGRSDVPTGGCVNCMSRTYCSCGAVLVCGTHLVIEDHKCPPTHLAGTVRWVAKP